MIMLRRCFAPCFTIKQTNCINLERGAIIIAVYTAVLHFVSLFYCIEVLNGGRTDAVSSPFFHMDKSVKFYATVGIVYSICFILFSFLLILGIKKEIRFFYLFWILCTFLELLLIFFIGIFLLYRYRYFPHAMYSLTVLWVYGIYHFYLFWVVISQYYYLKVFQEPTFLVLYA